MSWLNEWLREVVMVVLLATFVDLILPSRSMERYVKLVLSLLILLTLLQPIIKLFTDTPELRLSEAFQTQDMNSANFTNGKETTLQQILSKAEELKHQQLNQSLQWAGEEVARQMKQQIQEQAGTQVQEVQVHLSLLPTKNEDEQAIPSIVSVEVVLQQEPPDLQDQSNNDGNPSQQQQIAITPIAPVQVEVKIEPVETTGTSSGNSISDQSSNEKIASNDEQTADIVKILSKQWNLQSEQIKIIENGTDAKI